MVLACTGGSTRVAAGEARCGVAWRGGSSGTITSNVVSGTSCAPAPGLYTSRHVLCGSGSGWREGGVVSHVTDQPTNDTDASDALTVLNVQPMRQPNARGAKKK